MSHRNIGAARIIIVGCIVAGSMLAIPGASHAQSPVTPPGSGTSVDPYQISQLGHLVWMGDTVASSSGKYYTMTADIDASATATWNDAGTGTDVLEGFKPIGNYSSPDTTSFRGVFNGNGHTITGLNINRSSEDYVGLFGYVRQGGVVSGLRVIDSAVHGNNRVGGLIGSSYYSDGVSDCYSTGSVTGRAGYVGGLVGYSEGWPTAIWNCRAAGSVSGASCVGGLVGCSLATTVWNCISNCLVISSGMAGGLVGRSNHVISKSYATGSVSGSSSVGGLVGDGNKADVSESYATGSVTAASNVGGLIGSASIIKVSNCYATVSVRGVSRAGGLVGYTSSGTVSKCYATGALMEAGTYVAGLIGVNRSGMVSDSYWDTQTSGHTTSAGGAGKTTAELKQQATFAGWDFTTRWAIVEGTSYPYLQFSPPPFKLQVSSTGPGSVTVDPVSPDGTYAPGTVVTLTATPTGANDVFFGWLGAVPVESPTATVLMDSHRTVTAVFLTRIEINSLADLAKIGNDPAYPLAGTLYVLTADIDAFETANWNDPGTGADVLEGFKPIGNLNACFTSVFEGGGHTITGLVINRPTTNGVGLFGYVVAGGQVGNLAMLGGAVTGASGVGALVGSSYGRMSRCYATCSVMGTGDGVGGLVGYNSHQVSDSYTAGSVTGTSNVGGLVGASYGLLDGCYATGPVTGTSSVGGLAGTNTGTVTNSYATGSIVGTGTSVGGLVGYLDYGAMVLNSYWDMEKSGRSTSDGGTGKTTAEMKQQATFVGWDFASIWGIVENTTYPYLRSMSTDSDGDGVIDQIDACPGTVPGANVDAVGCPPAISGDFNHDGDVDSADFDAFQGCAAGPAVPYPDGCDAADFDHDNDVDQSDFGILQRCYSGEGIPADPGCAE